MKVNDMAMLNRIEVSAEKTIDLLLPIGAKGLQIRQAALNDLYDIMDDMPVVRKGATSPS